MDVVVSVVGVCSLVCSRSKSVFVGPGLQSVSFDALSRCLPTYSLQFCTFDKSHFWWVGREHGASKDSSTCKAAGNALGIFRYVL